METFCREIVTDITQARDEADLIHVITVSLSRLRKERNSFNETGYIMNMIVSLRAINTNDLSRRSIDNIKLATAIFRQLQRQSRQPIF
jgi:hypothetical protein